MITSTSTMGTCGPELGEAGCTTRAPGLLGGLESPRIENKVPSFSYPIYITSDGENVFRMLRRYALLGISRQPGEIELVLVRRTRLEAPAAAGLIHPGGPHHDQIAGFHQPLRMLGRITAAHTNC